jgi:hypothetical protein
MANKTRPSGKEEIAFTRWLEKTYGALKAMGIQLSFGSPWWESNAYFDTWVSLGRPGYATTQPKEEAPLSYNDYLNLSDDEQLEIVLDPSGSRLPDLAGTGWSWEWAFSPDTGNSWMMVSGEEAQGQGYPEGGNVVVPGQLLQLEDGSFIDYNLGLPVANETALQMIRSWLGTKDDTTLTEYEERNLNLALERLKWEKEAYGTLSAYEKQQLDLARQNLALEREQWLAGLQANPATWIERWYAEHLPAGTEMPETTPWGEPAPGIEAWTRQRFGGETTPQRGERVTVPRTAWSPEGEREVFVPEENTPTSVAPQTSGQAARAKIAAAYEQARSPQGYLYQLQAQGIPPSRWVESLGPNASPGMISYIARAKNAIETPLPGGYWSAYSQQPGVGIRPENVITLGKLTGSVKAPKKKLRNISTKSVPSGKLAGF